MLCGLFRCSVLIVMNSGWFGVVIVVICVMKCWLCLYMILLLSDVDNVFEWVSCLFFVIVYVEIVLVLLICYSWCSVLMLLVFCVGVCIMFCVSILCCLVSVSLVNVCICLVSVLSLIMWLFFFFRNMFCSCVLVLYLVCRLVDSEL